MSSDLARLPAALPRPVDDGAAAHLEASRLPAVVLPGTDGTSVNLAELKGRWVIYVYPMTGRPDVPLPDGWDRIPGARGCTPQSCGFRDRLGEFEALDTGVFGLSAQASDYQREARERLHLPFQLLSDSALQLKHKMRLPTFEVAGMELYKRLTLIAEEGRIAKVFYPVFPPDGNADEVLAWLRPVARLALAPTNTGGQVKITVETLVRAPIEAVWRAYTAADDIMQWNTASDDWHTTEARVDLRVGGEFLSRMEAKDGSSGFDFAGRYTEIVPLRLLAYSFGNRSATVGFTREADGVGVKVSFDAEETHSIEQQRTGWQAILDNFARYVESRESGAAS